MCVDVEGLKGETGLTGVEETATSTDSVTMVDPWQISARVLNLGPRSLRNARSSSFSRRLQQPTEPASDSCPS